MAETATPEASQPARPRKPGLLIYGWVLVIFVASNSLAQALGIELADNAIGNLYQYLDPEILRHDLARGLYYLHAQPPLFNLFLGSILKVFPRASTEAFAVAFGAMSLGLLLGMTWLMRRLGVTDLVIGILCLVFACSPSFMVYSRWVFYTLPVSLLVVLMAILLVQYLDSGRAGLAHLFSWSGALLMLTRALFHPLWFVVTVAGVATMVRPERRRTLLLSAIVPLLLINLWFVKNYFQVGTYGASSWVGMSLAKRWPLSQNEMASLRKEGKLPPVWHRRPFREPDELKARGYFQSGPFIHPAIDDPYKSNGQPNFNHRDYARISREMLPADLYLILHYPGRYLQRVGTAFLLYLQPGPNSAHFLVDYDFSRVGSYRDALTRIIFWGGPIERPIRMLEPPANLGLVAFPALVAFGLWRGFQRDGHESPNLRPVFSFMVITILWVTLVSNLIEIGENDRMRWEVEPLLVTLLGTAVMSALRFVDRLGTGKRL
jgi:hypothetical protein